MEKKEENILVVGSSESVALYKIFGCETFPVKDDNWLNEVKSLVKERDYKVIFIVEELYSEFIKSVKINKFSTAVIPVPSMKKDKLKIDIAKEKYKELSKIATGIKLKE